MMVVYEGSTIFGIVYYSENCVANVLSLGSTIDNSFRVRYLHLHDEFLVQVTEGCDTYIFKRDINTNTYICDLDKDVCDGKYINSKENNILVATVAQNKKKYSHRQIKAAAIARTYQNNLGPCSEGELIKLISRGKLDNNRVVAQDVIRALDIWGPSLSNLKGKTVSHKAELQDEIAILHDIQADQTMFVDLMFVNSIPYLISVFKPLEYVAVTKLLKKDIHTLLTTTISHMNIVRKHNLKVPLIRVDGESAMRTDWFVSKISAEGTILDTTGAGEAVSVVERKIRHIKERVRGISNTLPYKLTEQLESWLVRYVVSRINLVPTRNNPDYVSPREKLWGRRINVDKELKHGFGDYVQVHSNTIDNSMNERTSGSLALMPSGNLEGSWYYLLLINNEIVKRNKATPLPLSDDIIEYINKKALGRKGKIHTLSKPIFERGIHHELIDDIDHADNIAIDEFIPVIEENNHLDPNIPIDEDEYHYNIDNNIENIEDIPIDSPEEALDFIDESNIRGDNQALLDSIFGVDDEDDDNTLVTQDPENTAELDNVRTVPTEKLYPQTIQSDHIEPPIINVFTPRRSGRNHELNKWNKRTISITSALDTLSMSDRLYSNTINGRHKSIKRTFSSNMSVSQGVKKLRYTAINSISDLKVIQGLKIEDLSKEQISRIITSSMILK